MVNKAKKYRKRYRIKALLEVSALSLVAAGDFNQKPCSS